MTILMQEGEFTHTFDDSVNNTIKNGMLEKSHTDVHQAIDAALLLLCNFYDREKIIEDLKDCDYSIM